MRKEVAALGSTVFLFVAPGTVVVLLPWWLTGWRSGDWWPALRAAGLVPLIAGAVVLLSAYVRFVVEGLGTPAPVAPPEHLVVGGLYRYLRNPMYVAVIAAIAGQGLLLARPVLFAYGACAGVAMWAFAKGYEEPALTRRFGAGYVRYRQGVPGWRPRLTPWRDD
ncbi:MULTISPECIES: methyltransferase family protein [unclassified Streptomyces]|uniref:methyltransferase family protein n=1 Tax=unclassified Streptomyces TaxID=2593676 RepID=UPI00224FC91B|nr:MULTISPECIES: methyltransferase [unclassified Streptomyces]MCX5059909.1 isoprenylcysteine carboxyl methyltransferase [Streptomyces sp. NBC_00452]MCX5252311.1 isoprenylcysteine carboxyl methyltransferase [Streptomyces sp. NBC_00201]MCX5290820.1 isoprenylcysteine carboxyl methyltransferase [Streptomyces sp. NBC_00183]